MECVHLKDITEKITKGTTPSNIGDSFTDQGVMFFRSELIGKTKYVDKTKGLLYISSETHKKLKRSQICENDLLFSMAGVYLGKLSIAGKNDVPSNTNQAVALIRLKKDVCNVEYVYYYMKQNWFNELVCSYSAQAAQPNINLEQIGKLKIQLIDRPLQDKIVKILSAYDNLIENNTRRIRLLEQMAENLYKEWFVRFRFPGHEKAEFINGLPKGWKVERVKGIVKRLPFNRIYKGYELEEEGKVIVIDQSTDEYLGFHNNEPSHYADYDAPLILFGDHSCKFQLMTRNFSLGENVIPYTTNNNKEVNAYWLFYATHRLIQTEEYKRHWGRLTAMKVLVPDFLLQQRFENQVKVLEKEKNLLCTKNSLLARQRDLLLPRLMSGKLEVKG